ncbi:MAG TPA: hypothetical protein ENN74_02640, partial [Firmicutes bacterium]|nr:hypothetical protein [Bacillota bacterium]
MTHEVTRNRVAGILAAFLYAFSFGAISRSLGDTFYHEHVALPLLGVHLWFFFRALRRESVWNAILCALFLLGALLTWKVIEFYFLVLVLYFFLMFLRVGLERRELRLLGLITLGVLLTSTLFDVHLRYSRFSISRGMLAAYALLFTQAVVWKKGQRWKWLAVPMVLLLLALKAGLLPDTGRYGHVWQTFFYRLRYWHKPLDPTRLPFDVRHYWVPPYVSPNLFAFLNEVFWPVALALPGVVAFAGYLLLPGAWKPRPMPPERRQQAFLLLGFVAFLVFYLLFYKIKTFLLLFSIPWVGLAWMRWNGLALRPGAAVSVALCLLALVALLAYAWGPIAASVVAVVILIVWGQVRFVGLRIPQRVALGLLVFFAVLAQGYHTVAWNRSQLARALFALGIRQSSEKETGVVVSGGAIPDVLEWIGRESEPGEAFLAEFVLSPSILVYAERPINQHCFFESDMRLKYEEFAHALFKREEEFYAFCRKYETTYFVYNAHMLLRDDPNMSFRYITAHRGWSEDWAAYRFHFRPETLEHFRLAYQNDFMRVYRVLPPGESPGGSNRNRPYSPLFDEEVFE